jgi:PAS domain S-box-containing protein
MRDPTLAILQQELSAIYDNGPGILFKVIVEPNDEFRFVSMSQEGLLAMGVAREQVVGALVRDVIPPASRDHVLNNYREAIRSGHTVRWKEVSVYPTGQKVGEVAVTPLYDASGVATHLIGIVHDVTERERLEQALHQREERLQFLLRLNDALRPLSDPAEIQDVTLRLLGEHLGVNRVAYSVIDGEEFIVTRSYEHGVAPLRGRWLIRDFGAALLESYERGETVKASDVRTDPRFTETERANLSARGIGAFVRVTLCKEGRWVATLGVNSLPPRVWIPDEVALIEQTAERMWSAAERSQAEAALRESEDRLRLAQAGGMVGVWDWNPTTGRVTWSPELAAIFGLEAKVVRSYEDFANRVHPDDLARIESIRDAAVRRHEPFTMEFRIVLPSGEIRWVSVWGRGFYDADGRPKRVVGNNIVITERKRTEEALRLSEQRYRLTLSGSPVTVWECDSDLRFTFVDNLQPPVTDPARIIGKRDDEILPVDYVGELIEIKKRVLATGVGERGQLSIPAANGVSHFEMVIEPIHKSDSTIAGLRGLAIDVSERKRTEDALRTVSAELGQTLHIAAVGLTHCSRDLRYLSANPAYAQYVGLPLEQIIGRPIVEVIGKPAFEIIRPRIERVLRGEMVEYEDEVSIGGVRKYIRAACTPERDVSGNVVGWVASVMDTTERRRAEETVRRHANLLLLSFDAIIVWQLDGAIESWSKGAEALYGFTEREAIGHRSHDLFKTVFPVSCSETEAILRDQGRWEGELRHRTKDHREIIVSARLQCIRGDDGIVRVLEINRDISERKRLEHEREKEAQRKDEFLAFLGHELRNPLAAIQTAIHVLSSDPTATQRVSMEAIIGRQTAMMRRLVDDLLELERISHGHIELKRERLDLAECLQRAAAAIHATVASRGQELHLRLPSDTAPFMADDARLQQIMANLLSNASKYTEPGGRIELSAAREGPDVVLRCKDNGCGVLPEVQKKIFEPFFRATKTDLGYGEASVGLGLALTKQLTELHGGTVSVESGGAGQGSEFTVRLPLVAPPSDRQVTAEPKHATTLRAQSVVIVEDNPSVAETLMIALEQAGHVVHRFADGPSALAGISALRPDAVLVDIGLPHVDGYEVAARLKMLENTRNALYIAVSGFRQRQQPGQAGDNFDHYFNKPVDVGALLALLDER